MKLDGVGRVGDRGHSVGVLDAGVLVHVGVGRLAGLQRAVTAHADRGTNGDEGDERRRTAGDGAHIAVLVGLVLVVTVPRGGDEFLRRRARCAHVWASRDTAFRRITAVSNTNMHSLLEVSPESRTTVG